MTKKYDLLNIALGLVAIAILAFIYLPMLVVVVYSFNSESVNSFPMQGFSLKWYSVMLENQPLMTSLKYSLIIATLGTAVALLIGIPAALAFRKYNFWGKKILERLILLPITLPGILTGVAMLSFFPLIGIHLSLKAVMIGHVTFLISIIITQVYARLKRLDPYIEEASTDLGATPLNTFRRVTLPSIKTAVIGASLLSVALSLDEIPVTFFLIARDNTLPIQIYTMLRQGITPEVNAIATVIFVFSLVLLVGSIRYSEGGVRKSIA